MLKKVAFSLYVLTVLGLVLAYVKSGATQENPLHNTSVKITNNEMDHGGTGIIFKSTTNKSMILTNAHVCEIVKKGGVVITETTNYQVNSTKISKISDLCILTVLSDLYYSTKFANKSPQMYDEVVVVGHPALMPNIISKGHLSGKEMLPIVTGLKPCNYNDYIIDPESCISLGGIPVTRTFESRLVSATIMPGSSGSGVYNTNNELIGVVFAGHGDFGYGWTVPYEQVKAFLEVEQNTLADVLTTKEVSFNKPNQESKLKEAIFKCSKHAFKNYNKFKNICEILNRDSTWRK